MSGPEGVGVWSIELRFHREREEVAEAAAELEGLGYTALFIPGARGGDLMGAAERLLTATAGVPVALGVANLWKHDAAELAADHARLRAEHGARLLTGIGVSHAEAVDADEPGRYRKPLEVVGKYLDRLDGAPMPVRGDERFLGALGPRMLGLSAARTLGAHPYFVSVDHTATARELLGPEAWLAPEQAVVLETDPVAARAVARAHMERYLAAPNYVRNLQRSGFDEHELADGGSDRLVDALVAWGDEQAILDRVAEHRDRGADHVCVQVLTAGEGLPRVEWRRLAAALTHAG
ncbi:MAG TPA: TIGR03620 family F420-dependent LLM class oxidoreductase [Baekduia sp.]|jgi:probable F420-dependent oxidoreductase